MGLCLRAGIEHGRRNGCAEISLPLLLYSHIGPSSCGLDLGWGLAVSSALERYR